MYYRRPMGATVPFSCPVDGCDYTTQFRLGVGEETDSDAYAERVGWLRDEHPNHPPPDKRTAPAAPPRG